MKALIAVMTCWKLDYGDGSLQVNPRVSVVRETWLTFVKELFPNGEHQVDVKFFYGAAKNPGLDTRLRPLGLSAAEKRDLIAFLRSLSGRIQEGL